MSRRVFLGGLSLVAFAAPPAAETQPAKKMPLIGVIHTENCGPGRLSVDSFRQGLRDHGYVEGQTIVVDCRSGYGKPEFLPRLAAELVERHVDLPLHDRSCRRPPRERCNPKHSDRRGGPGE
jgi:putative tryptophan/tyrosine transport system substrate-binding protein